MTGDEQLYLDATNEVEGNSRNPALWAKVMALSEGDETKAKYKYINLRVESFRKEIKRKEKKMNSWKPLNKLKVKNICERLIQ